MIRHYFKLVWKRRRQNGFLVLQFVLVFWVIFASFSFFLDELKSYRTPLGFGWEDVYRINLMMEIDSAQQHDQLSALKKELEALPEMEAVSHSIAIAPYLGSMWMNGGSNKEEGITFQTHYMESDEDYARVWTLDVVKGRYFTREDRGEKYIPMVVNQKFVDEFMKGKEPLGFAFDYLGQKAEIIGVVSHFKYIGDFAEEAAFAFVPVQKWENASMLNFKVRKGTGPEIQSSVRDVVERVTKSSDFEIVRVEEQRAFKNNLTLIPLGILSFVALFLIINIILGLFGILRYNIAKRTSEIGLRKALGASSSAIKRQFTGEIMVLTFLAFAIAFIFAVQLPFLTPLPVDKGTYFSGIGLGTALIFGLVYMCAIAPSHQAAQVPPAQALRED